MEKFKDYRPNVAAIVLSSDYSETQEFLIARRKGVRRGWQFPQGGIDAGEKPEEALLRELKEEIGTSDVEIIAEYPYWISYDFPETSKNKIYPYRGQRQKYFLVRLKESAEINLNSYQKPEFDEYQFVTEEVLFKKAAFLKRRVYRRVLDYFIKKGLL